MREEEEEELVEELKERYVEEDLIEDEIRIYEDYLRYSKYTEEEIILKLEWFMRQPKQVRKRIVEVARRALERV